MNKTQYIDWLEETLYQAGFLSEKEIEQAIDNLKELIKEDISIADYIETQGYELEYERAEEECYTKNNIDIIIKLIA